MADTNIDKPARGTFAAHLIAGNPALEPVLPAFYASRHPDLGKLIDARWADGSAFWLRTRA